MRVTVITPPDPFVTLDEAGLRLRLGDDLDREHLVMLHRAACRHLEPPHGWLGRAIGEQLLEVRMDAADANGCEGIRLPFPPVIEVERIQWIDGSGAEIDGTLADFELMGDRLLPATGWQWPWTGAVSGRREAVRIRYRAGYAVVPEDIKAAVTSMIVDMVEFPESVIEGTVSAVRIPASAEMLLASYRVYGG